MKKNCGENRVTCTLGRFEQKTIQKAYFILTKLFTSLCDSAIDFEPHEGEIFCTRINGDEVILLEELQNFIDKMEDFVSIKNVSCSFEAVDDDNLSFADEDECD